jgi:hypothetical protein
MPIRPYDVFFKWIPTFTSSPATNAHPVGQSIGQIFGVLLAILILAAFLPSIANATTGITIAHTGFTPNPNITSSPGLVSLVRTAPLVAIGIGIGWALDDLGTLL